VGGGVGKVSKAKRKKKLDGQWGEKKNSKKKTEIRAVQGKEKK
jgi:hypothetical protein